MTKFHAYEKPCWKLFETMKVQAESCKTRNGQNHERWSFEIWGNSRAIALNLVMAGDPGGLCGEMTPAIALWSRVCCTVIVCRKSDGKLIFEPGSFFNSFNLDLLNFPGKTETLQNRNRSDISLYLSSWWASASVALSWNAIPSLTSLFPSLATPVLSAAVVPRASSVSFEPYSDPLPCNATPVGTNTID